MVWTDEYKAERARLDAQEDASIKSAIKRMQEPIVLPSYQSSVDFLKKQNNVVQATSTKSPFVDKPDFITQKLPTSELSYRSKNSGSETIAIQDYLARMELRQKSESVPSTEGLNGNSYCLFTQDADDIVKRLNDADLPVSILSTQGLDVALKTIEARRNLRFFSRKEFGSIFDELGILENYKTLTYLSLIDIFPKKPKLENIILKKEFPLIRPNEFLIFEEPRILFEEKKPKKIYSSDGFFLRDQKKLPERDILILDSKKPRIYS